MYFPAAKLGGLNFYNDSFQGWFSPFPHEGIGAQMSISPELMFDASTTSRLHLLVSIQSISSINKMLNKKKRDPFFVCLWGLF